MYDDTLSDSPVDFDLVQIGVTYRSPTGYGGNRASTYCEFVLTFPYPCDGGAPHIRNVIVHTHSDELDTREPIPSFIDAHTALLQPTDRYPELQMGEPLEGAIRVVHAIQEISSYPENGKKSLAPDRVLCDRILEFRYGSWNQKFEQHDYPWERRAQLPPRFNKSLVTEILNIHDKKLIVAGPLEAANVDKWARCISDSSGGMLSESPHGKYVPHGYFVEGRRTLAQTLRNYVKQQLTEDATRPRLMPPVVSYGSGASLTELLRAFPAKGATQLVSSPSPPDVSAKYDAEKLMYAAFLTALNAREQGTGLMAVIKDVYGHPLDPEGKRLEAMERGFKSVLPPEQIGFCCFTPDEALETRYAGIDVTILALHIGSDDNLTQLLANGIDLCVRNLHDLERIKNAAERFNIGATERLNVGVHLRVDTGEGLGGVPTKDWPQFIAQVSEYEARGVFTVKAIMGHQAREHKANGVLPNGKPFLDPHRQADIFLERVRAAWLLGVRPAYVHFSRSGGAVDPELQDKIVAGLKELPIVDGKPESELPKVWLRPGAMIYGQLRGQEEATAGIDQTLTIEATLTSLTHASTGRTFGYDEAYLVEENEWIGHLPMGQSEGVSEAWIGHEIVFPHNPSPVKGVVVAIASDQLVLKFKDFDPARDFGSSNLNVVEPRRKTAVITGDGGPTLAQLGESLGVGNEFVIPHHFAHSPRTVLSTVNAGFLEH